MVSECLKRHLEVSLFSESIEKDQAVCTNKNVLIFVGIVGKLHRIRLKEKKKPPESDLNASEDIWSPFIHSG